MLSRIKYNRRHRKTRRGTTAVETAMVMPMFIFFLYMVLEVSHMLVVTATVKSASRNAARQGTTSVSSTQQVIDYARQFSNSVIPNDAMTIRVCDASGFDDGSDDISQRSVRDGLSNIELRDAESGTLFMVQIVVQYDDILFIPWPFTQNVEFEGRSFQRKE